MTGDFYSGPARVHEAWEKLARVWQETRPSWHDTVASRLEEQLFDVPAAEKRDLTERMQSLGSLFRRVAQEVRE